MTVDVALTSASNENPLPDCLNLRSLRSFVAVADCGGFRKAALRLNVTQPAISFQMRRLQQSLGIRLFLRGNRVRLTAEGRLLYRHALQLLSLNDAIIAALQPHREHEANGNNFHPAEPGHAEKEVSIPCSFPVAEITGSGRKSAMWLISRNSSR